MFLPQTRFTPSWKSLGFRNDEDPLFFAFLLKYYDSFGDASYLQEWCFTWREAKSGRVAIGFQNCSLGESELIHAKLAKTVFEFR